MQRPNLVRMHLVGIQVGSPSTLRTASRTITTGIDKKAIDAVRIGTLGLEGDAILDTEHHGGIDAAVYVYSLEDYAWWEAELGRMLVPGTFGENLTLSSFPAGPVRSGDRYRVGDVDLEVTNPRIPCGTFSAHMGETDWIRRFRDARRPGWYGRVITPGIVTVGDTVTVVPAADDAPDILGVQDQYYEGRAS